MSLRDQLLKAGLVTREQAEKVESNTRKKAHQANKDKTLAKAEAARKAAEQRRLEAEAQRKRERDQQLNRQREEKKKRKEIRMRARQLIDSNRLNEPDAEIRYNFSADGRTIKSMWVTEKQQKRIACGLIGIAGTKAHDFALIPRDAALKLQEFYPEAVLLLYPESDGSEEDDWWGDVDAGSDSDD